MRRHPLTRSARASLAVVALVCALAACGGDATTTASPTTATSSSTGTGTATVDPACADVTDLRASLEALTQVEPLKDGTDALKAAMAEVKTDLDTAASSTSTTLQPDVEQVRTALAALESAAAGLSSDNLRAKAPEIATALKQVAAATSALGTTLTQTCPSG